MRIFLLNPPSLRAGKLYVREGRCTDEISTTWDSLWPPMSLAYIAAVLRETGYKVDLVEAMALRMSMPGLIKKFTNFRPDLVIVNTATPTIDNDLEIIRQLRIAYDTKFALYGVHVTALDEELARHPQVDFIIRGEPEETAKELAENVNAPERVLGLTHKNGRNADRPPIKNLDAMPFPARDLLPNSSYVQPFDKRKFTVVIPARGCFNRCLFCTAHTYYPQIPRRRSPDNIIAELKEIKDTYDITDVLFFADTFTTDKKWVIELCRKMRAIGIDWMCNSRVDTVDVALLKEMKVAGCHLMSYGVETVSPQILKNIRKNTTAEQIKCALINSREVGIKSAAYFIIGLPGETRDTVRETIKFAKKYADYAQFYCAVPYPGSDLWEVAVKNNWISETCKFSDYVFHKAIMRNERLSAREIETLTQLAYRQFYLRPAYILKTLFERGLAGQFSDTVSQGLKFIKSRMIDQW